MAHQLPKLNFPAIRLRASNREGETYVWDELRHSWLLLTPEEWVRRHTIGWLISRGIAPLRIAQEHLVTIESQPQRADIVVFGDDARPLIVVECKAPSVALSADTFNQAVRYNSILGATYLMLTNGLEHRFYQFDGKEYQPILNLKF